MKRSYQFTKRNNGYYYYRLKGQGWKSTGVKDEGLARAIAMEKSRRFNVGPVSATLLIDYLRIFFTDDCPHVKYKKMIGEPLSPGYIKHMRSLIVRFVFTDPIANYTVGEVTKGRLICFQERLFEKTGSLHVVNRTIKALSLCFGDACKKDLLDYNPVTGIELSNPKPKEKPIFSLSQLSLLFPLNSVGPWASREMKCAFLLAATTGMRRSEVLALRWENVREDVVPGQGSIPWVFICEAVKGNTKDAPIGLPKNGTKRDSVLAKRLYNELMLLAPTSLAKNKTGNDYVFCNEEGKRRSYRWWNDGFNKALRKAGIPKTLGFVPHCFRHTLNTHLRPKVDNSLLRTTFGWGDEAIQNHYTHLGIEQMSAVDQAINNLFPVPE